VFGADTGFILSRAPDTVRAPEIAFVAKDRFDAELPVGYVPFAPDLAVEGRIRACQRHPVTVDILQKSTYNRSNGPSGGHETRCGRSRKGNRMSIIRSELLRGTLDLLILKTLTLEPMHGWGIAQRIRDFSGHILAVNQGSLYPALRRLQRQGWVSSEWLTTDNNRRARVYTLTAEGRRQLGQEEEQWALSSSAVNRVLELGLAGA